MAVSGALPVRMYVVCLVCLFITSYAAAQRRDVLLSICWPYGLSLHDSFNRVYQCLSKYTIIPLSKEFTNARLEQCRHPHAFPVAATTGSFRLREKLLHSYQKNGDLFS